MKKLPDPTSATLERKIVQKVVTTAAACKQAEDPAATSEHNVATAAADKKDEAATKKRDENFDEATAAEDKEKNEATASAAKKQSDREDILRSQNNENCKSE